MKAIVSVYKSEIVDYMEKAGLKEDEVVMICSSADFERAKDNEGIKDIVLLSAPMGIPMNLDYLRFSLIKAETEVKPIAEQVLDEPLEDMTPKMESAPEGDPEAEVKEIVESPSAEDSDKTAVLPTPPPAPKKKTPVKKAAERAAKKK